MSSSPLKTHLLHDVAEAAEFLQRGKLVAFPTETVFGLGADARNAHAIERLFLAKGRPADNPLIVHLADSKDWPMAAAELPELARRILERYSPGPVTVVIPKSAQICSSVTAGLNTVGVRIPANELTRSLLRAAAIPIAAPSANLSGRPSGTSWQSVLEDLDGRIDAILCLDVEHLGLESTVIDCTTADPILLRPGSLGLAELKQLYPNARALNPVFNSASLLGSSSHEVDQCEQASPNQPRGKDSHPTVASPGLRHPHYQPVARVQLIEGAESWSRERAGGLKCAYAGLDAPPSGVTFSHQYRDIDDYAHGFYEFLRTADRQGIELVVLQGIAVETAAQTGIAAALRDRQRRAAGLDSHDCSG